MKNKILILILVVLIAVAGLMYLKNKNSDEKLVGNDKTSEGCITSAGYTFSNLKSKCIRLFEDGVRLNPEKDIKDQTLSAFVVFKEENVDDQKAEIFIPNIKDSQILDKETGDGAGTWKNSNYKLMYWKGMYMLHNKNDKMLYSGGLNK